MVEIAGDASPKRKPMGIGELKGILNAHVVNSLGYYGGKLAKVRVSAMQYYNGEPFGNELEGRSQVISRDVAEAIDSMMPSLMKIFTAGDEVVRFDPTRPQDEQAAKQATDYCNWVWQQQNEGFHNTFQWFKDALLNRVGAIKIWWDTELTTNRETYEGLTDGELAILLEDTEDEELEILEQTSYPDPMAAAVAPPAAPPGAGGTPSAMPPAQLPPGQTGMPPMGAREAPAPIPMLHNVVLRRTNKTGRIRVLPIPGEEFLMDRRAVALSETPFVAHRVKKTISDLLEMGYPYDLIKDLGEGDSTDFNIERLERFRQEDELPYRTGNNYDPSMKEVWINECYLKVDFDGDGIAELRKITFAGEAGNFAPGATVILDNDEIDDHPFAALTPIPMPHKFYGMSIADQVMDLQLIKSTIWRTSLDHTYNAIMPQLGVLESQVNLDDLLTRKPGGLVRMRALGAIEAIPSGEMGVDPMQMISYIDQVREQRTGVQRFTAGPGADVLDNAYVNTATGINSVENSSQERLELVARCFAEIGMKQAFYKILKLTTMHQHKPMMIRLRGEFVEMDPREWDTKFDMTVAVGLGTGNRQQQLQGMSMLLNLDKEIIGVQGGLNGPLLTAENVYNKLDKVCSYMGLRNASPYYTDPKSAVPQPQQQKPDPKVEAAQIAAQADQQKTQMQIQAQQQRAQSDAQFEAQKLQMQMAAERQKMQLELQMQERLQMAKIAADREIQYARIAADREEFNADAQLKLHQHATDTALKTKSMETDQGFRERDDSFRREKKGLEPIKPKPKVSKISLVRGQDGRASAAHRHYDDGSVETIPIERVNAA